MDYSVVSGSETQLHISKIIKLKTLAALGSNRPVRKVASLTEKTRVDQEK